MQSYHCYCMLITCRTYTVFSSCSLYTLYILCSTVHCTFHTLYTLRCVKCHSLRLYILHFLYISSLAGTEHGGREEGWSVVHRDGSEDNRCQYLHRRYVLVCWNVLVFLLECTVLGNRLYILTTAVYLLLCWG